MPESFLSPASVSYLALFLLTLRITIYLAFFHLRGGIPAARRPRRAGVIRPAALRDSPLLLVEECSLCGEIGVIGTFHPDLILVDGAQITPEQFHELLTSIPPPVCADQY